MLKRLRVNGDCCTGCMSCQLACSFSKEGVFSPALSRVAVEVDQEEARFGPRVCIQCEAAPCIEVCPVGALTREEATGAIRLDEASCIGCRRCVEACPYVGIRFDEERGLPLICDLCGGAPACVDVCRFPEAIQYTEEGGAR